PGFRRLRGWRYGPWEHSFTASRGGGLPFKHDLTSISTPVKRVGGARRYIFRGGLPLGFVSGPTERRARRLAAVVPASRAQRPAAAVAAGRAARRLRARAAAAAADLCPTGPG